MHGPFGWIVDGATGVSGRRMTPGPSDAAWLAGTISANLASLAGDGIPVRSVLPLVEAAVAQAFRALQIHQVCSEHPGPSACLGLIGIAASQDGPRLEGAFFGDVAALVPTAEGIVRWTDERAKSFEARTLAALGSHAPSSGTITEMARLQIVENRRKLNRPDGYWAVHPELSWAGREITFETPLVPDAPIVLATDGFMRLVDVFGAYTDDTLYNALASGEANRLMNELRDCECDLMAPARRRVKKHDDATVLVLDIRE